MDASEWIIPNFFTILNFKKFNGHALQLYNLNKSLSDIKTSSYLIKRSGILLKYIIIMIITISKYILCIYIYIISNKYKIKKKNIGDTEPFIKKYNMDFEELSDIQKKINPIMTISLSNNDIFPTIRESISHKRTSDEESLIVVACLLSRTPNLGGLARTCEIFNVKELVIANLNQVKDKEFQNLSVSAENWITITEVLYYYINNDSEIFVIINLTQSL